MRFLLDESADYVLAGYLRSHGHDVTAIAHDYPQALEDEEVLQIARREHRILIANDTDFGELVVRRRLPHAGVILFRLEREAVPVKIAWLGRVLAQHPHDLEHLIVVTRRGIRIRRTVTR